MLELEKYISVEEFFYEKNQLIESQASIWGDFNFCFNAILQYEIEAHLPRSPPS